MCRNLRPLYDAGSYFMSMRTVDRTRTTRAVYLTHVFSLLANKKEEVNRAGRAARVSSKGMLALNTDRGEYIGSRGRAGEEYLVARYSSIRHLPGIRMRHRGRRDKERLRFDAPRRAFGNSRRDCSARDARSRDDAERRR